jgi:hypothetical protein
MVALGWCPHAQPGIPGTASVGCQHSCREAAPLTDGGFAGAGRCRRWSYPARGSCDCKRPLAPTHVTCSVWATSTTSSRPLATPATCRQLPNPNPARNPYLGVSAATFSLRIPGPLCASLLIQRTEQAAPSYSGGSGFVSKTLAPNLVPLHCRLWLPRSP